MKKKLDVRIAWVAALAVWYTPAFAGVDRCASPSAEEFARNPELSSSASEIRDIAAGVRRKAEPLIAASVAREREAERERQAEREAEQARLRAEREAASVAREQEAERERQAERTRRQAEREAEQARLRAEREAASVAREQEAERERQAERTRRQAEREAEQARLRAETAASQGVSTSSGGSVGEEQDWRAWCTERYSRRDWLDTLERLGLAGEQDLRYPCEE